jgi:hypothetical protein
MEDFNSEQMPAFSESVADLLPFLLSQIAAKAVLQSPLSFIPSTLCILSISPLFPRPHLIIGAPDLRKERAAGIMIFHHFRLLHFFLKFSIMGLHHLNRPLKIRGQVLPPGSTGVMIFFCLTIYHLTSRTTGMEIRNSKLVTCNSL